MVSNYILIQHFSTSNSLTGVIKHFEQTMYQHVADLFSSFLSFEKLTLVAEQNAKNEKFSSFENPFVYLFVDLL